MMKFGTIDLRHETIEELFFEVMRQKPRRDARCVSISHDRCIFDEMKNSRLRRCAI